MLFAISLALLGGCWGNLCVGADCGETFNGARIHILKGMATGWESQVDPAEAADITMEGADTLGSDWVLQIGPDTLLVGMPEVAQVFRFSQSDLKPPSTARYTARWTDEAHTEFGHSLSFSADLTGDGALDLLVGAPSALGLDDGGSGGRVYLLSNAGDADDDTTPTLSAALVALGISPFDRLGDVVQTCGDMDGDGIADWAASAPWDESGGASIAGSVSIALSTRTLALDPATAIAGLPITDLGPRFTSAVDGARAGTAISCTHDLTGDGISDLLVGAPYADDPLQDHEASGTVYVIDPTEYPEGGDLAASARWKLRGSNPEVYAGFSLATGDIDQDGVPEVLVGAPGALGGVGRAILFTGLATQKEYVYPLFGFRGEAEEDRFGAAVALADVTGDGAIDVLVGAPRRNVLGTNQTFASGALYVWVGPRDMVSWDKSRNAIDATTVFSTEDAQLFTGGSLATGNLDADGVPYLGLVQRVTTAP